MGDPDPYILRTAIGNERLLGMTADKVRFKTRVNRRAVDHGEGRPHSAVTTLPGPEFIARLMQHVVPASFKRIRHCGLLAPSAKAQRLATARALLATPQPDPAMTEEARAFMLRVAGIDNGQCPHCHHGRWQVIACQPAQRPASGQGPAINNPQSAKGCRGPP